MIDFVRLVIFLKKLAKKFVYLWNILQLCSVKDDVINKQTK